MGKQEAKKQRTKKKDTALAVSAPMKFDDLMRRVTRVKPPSQWKFSRNAKPAKK